MVFAVSKLPGEPILIVTLDLPLEQHLQSWRSLTAALARFVTEAERGIAVVFDLRDQEVSFSDILIGISELQASAADWIVDPNMSLVIVGEHPMLDITARRVDQQFHFLPPRFATMEEALAQIRAARDAEDDSDDATPSPHP
jgi:hypothetical protein